MHEQGDPAPVKGLRVWREKVAAERRARAPDEAAEDDEDVGDVECPVDLPGALLGGGHRAPDRRDVRVVPGVVVHQHRPVRHRRRLVPVVPPACILVDIEVFWV